MIFQPRLNECLVFRRQTGIVEFDRPTNEKLPFRDREGGKFIKDSRETHGIKVFANRF